MKLNPLLVIAGLFLLVMIAKPQESTGVPYSDCDFAGVQTYSSYWCKPMVNQIVSYEGSSEYQGKLVCQKSCTGICLEEITVCTGEISCPSNTPVCNVRAFPTFSGALLPLFVNHKLTGELIYKYPSGAERTRTSIDTSISTGQYYQIPVDTLKTNEKLNLKIEVHEPSSLFVTVTMKVGKSYVPHSLVISAHGATDYPVVNANGCDAVPNDVCISGCDLNSNPSEKIVPWDGYRNFVSYVATIPATTLQNHPVYGRGVCYPLQKKFVPYNHKIALLNGNCYYTPADKYEVNSPAAISVECCPGEPSGTKTCDNNFKWVDSSIVKTTCSPFTGLAGCEGGGGQFIDTSDQSFTTFKQATSCSPTGECVYKTWKVECTASIQCGQGKYCNFATGKCSEDIPKPQDCRTQGCSAGYTCNQLTGECTKPSGGIDWLLIAIVGGALIMGYGVLGDKTKTKGRK